MLEAIPDSDLAYHQKNKGLNLKNIAVLVDAVNWLNKIQTMKFPVKEGEHETGLELADFSWYVLKLSSNFKRIDKFIKPKLRDDIYSIFFRNRDLIDGARKVLGHEDLRIDNIIFSHQKVYITDWEGAMITNYVHNISDLYYNIWFDQKARKILLREYLRTNKLTNEFKVLFRLGVIRWLLSGVTHCVSSSSEKDVLKGRISKEFTKPFRADLITVKKALKGFDDLL
jgi:thiamine kinase-like enzyme